MTIIDQLDQIEARLAVQEAKFEVQQTQIEQQEALIEQQHARLAEQQEKLDGYASKFAAQAKVLQASQRTAEQAQTNVARLEAELAASTEGWSAAEASQGTSSRRDLLKKGGLGVAALAAGAVGGVAVQSSGGGADGDGLVLGQANGATSATSITGTPETGNILTVSGNATDTAFPSAIGAYGYTPAVSNGVYGYSTARSDADPQTGHALIGIASASGRSSLLLNSSLGDPRASAIPHTVGEFVVDADANLWFCMEAGTPGTWRKLAGTASAGSLHAIAPKRVWDTRFQDGGPMAADETRTVSVADGRELSSATVDVPDLVPRGATAVMVNLAVTGTGPAGFMALSPAGTPHSASSINWFEENSTLANTTMTTLNDNRELTVFSSSAGHFILDITGYWL